MHTKFLKNRKTTDIDNINMELLKFGGLSLMLQVLRFINMCWTNMIF